MKITGPNAGGYLLVALLVWLAWSNENARGLIILFAGIALLPLVVAIVVNLIADHEVRAGRLKE